MILDGQLYRKSFPYPLFKLLRPIEADHISWKIHEGICENHLGDRSLAYNASR